MVPFKLGLTRCSVTGKWWGLNACSGSAPLVKAVEVAKVPPVPAALLSAAVTFLPPFLQGFFDRFLFHYSRKDVFLEICLLLSTNWTTAYMPVLAPAHIPSLVMKLTAAILMSDLYCICLYIYITLTFFLPLWHVVVFLPLPALAFSTVGLNLKGSYPG